MSINYHNRKFKPIRQSKNSESDSDTMFLYVQQGDIVTSKYTGGKIREGHLIARVNEGGTLDMRYHQINEKGELMTGTCKSIPEVLKDGRIRLHEKWQWTSGDFSEGESTMEEIL